MNAGCHRVVITAKGTTKYLVLTEMQREAMRFHLDNAKAFPYGSDRRNLHMSVARAIGGFLDTEDKPARTRNVRSTSNHPNLAEYRDSTRRAA